MNVCGKVSSEARDGLGGSLPTGCLKTSRWSGVEIRKASLKDGWVLRREMSWVGRCLRLSSLLSMQRARHRRWEIEAPPRCCGEKSWVVPHISIELLTKSVVALLIIIDTVELLLWSVDYLWMLAQVDTLLHIVIFFSFFLSLPSFSGLNTLDSTSA